MGKQARGIINCTLSFSRGNKQGKSFEGGGVTMDGGGRREIIVQNTRFTLIRLCEKF